MAAAFFYGGLVLLYKPTIRVSDYDIITRQPTLSLHKVYQNCESGLLATDCVCSEARIAK